MGKIKGPGDYILLLIRVYYTIYDISHLCIISFIIFICWSLCFLPWHWREGFLVSLELLVLTGPFSHRAEVQGFCWLNVRLSLSFEVLSSWLTLLVFETVPGGRIFHASCSASLFVSLSSIILRVSRENFWLIRACMIKMDLSR